MNLRDPRTVQSLLHMLRGGGDPQGVGGGRRAMPEDASQASGPGGGSFSDLGGSFSGGGGGGLGGGGGVVGGPDGISLADLASGYGPEWKSNPELNSGAPYRPITSPEDQNWNDPQGNPIHMGGPAPAYNPGTSVGGFPSIFDAKAPNTGGYFALNDYFAQAPEGTSPIAPGSRNNAPSTNNWRLLGNDPDNFMINGNIINRRDMGRELAFKSVMGQEGGGPHGIFNVRGGLGLWSRPTSSGGYEIGYPGGPNWGTGSTPSY